MCELCDCSDINECAQRRLSLLCFLH